MVPTTILVPIDDRQMPESALEQIAGQAGSSCSKVILMGIVPVHLYNPSEEELELVRKATVDAVGNAAAQLSRKGIITEEMITTGYPDEEIINRAEELKVSMIVIPCTKDRPSELSKAATIILDEDRKVNIPILYVPV